MTVVIDFDGRIDAELDRLFNDRTILAGDAQRDVLAGSDVVGHPEDI